MVCILANLKTEVAREWVFSIIPIEIYGQFNQMKWNRRFMLIYHNAIISLCHKILIILRFGVSQGFVYHSNGIDHQRHIESTTKFVVSAVPTNLIKPSRGSIHIHACVWVYHRKVCESYWWRENVGHGSMFHRTGWCISSMNQNGGIKAVIKTKTTNCW